MSACLLGFRRWRRRPFFSWFFKGIDEVFRDFERLFEREMKRPFKEVRGPFIYGFSVTVGPDGRPRVREFGNIQPARFSAEIREMREPLVDVYETKDEVKVVAELPRVGLFLSKKSYQLSSNNFLHIKAVFNYDFIWDWQRLHDFPPVLKIV